jgi:hypothetical protein
MAITKTLGTLTTPVPSIQTQTQTAFSENADNAFIYLGDLAPDINIFTGQANTLQTDVNAKQVTASSAATTATDQAKISTTKAGEAAQSAIEAASAVSTLPDGTINDAQTTLTNAWSATKIDTELTNLNTDPTLNNFTRATATGDTFSVQYAKTSPGAGVVSLYKEVASVDETSNVFSATAVGNAFEYDNTKLDFVGGNLVLKDLGAGTYTANEYLPAITSNPLDTQYWTQLTSLSATDTPNGQSAFYAYSSDSRASWLVIEAGSTERAIARNNAGTWEYNSNVT